MFVQIQHDLKRSITNLSVGNWKQCPPVLLLYFIVEVTIISNNHTVRVIGNVDHDQKKIIFTVTVKNREQSSCNKIYTFIKCDKT